MRFDVVIIGGGLAGTTAATALQQAGLRCVLVSAGLSLNETSHAPFRAAGGTVLAGDTVTGGTLAGGRVLNVSTLKLGSEPLEADAFVLATGKYFSRGIVADMDRIYEPVFGLDVDYDSDRSTWFAPSFGAHQRFLDFGVCSGGGCALKDGERILNLFPAGEVLATVSGSCGDASEPIRRSAMEAVDNILKGRNV